MPCTVVVGGFFGDEGKGKIIAYLAMKDKPRIVARGGVGPNAGHTVNYMGKSYFLRMIPSGFVYEGSRLLIGPGVLVNPKVFLEEVKLTNTEKRIGLDKQCAIIEEKHIQQEIQSKYLVEKIGTTKSGVGYCQAERALRMVRLAKDIEELSPYVTDVSLEINEALENEEKVLIEGTQGTFLSLYHGTYPFCTSKDVCASAICSDVGVGPKSVEHVIIVFKAYITRVGEGPLEGELPRDEIIKRSWLEYGTVTRRERRAAPFNFELAKKAVRLNSATQAVLTKIDILYPNCKGIKDFNKLPKEAKDFIEKVESEIRIPIVLIGTGPSTFDIIDRRNEL